MDACLPDWNTDVGGEFLLPIQKKSLGLENELIELLWQNGEIVLHSQTNRKQTKQIRDPNQCGLIQDDDEAVSWIDCPIDESFERDFCANFLSEIPPNLDESSKGERGFKSGASEVIPQGFAPPPPPPPPRFEAVARHQPQLSGRSRECSGMTLGSSHCASNQVDLSWASSCGVGTMAAGAINEGVEREAPGQARESCSGGSGSSLWKTSSLSNETSRHKRKSRDVEESECPSDATESESAGGSKAKNGTARRSRVAEVHNLSERRRRDRINEKMKALQELIPHANKVRIKLNQDFKILEIHSCSSFEVSSVQSDKASMLDEAIEYMKSLQLQIQLMWMGRGMGMAPVMLPGVQHYMSRVGMGIGPTMMPGIHNLMRLSRLPLVDQAMSVPPAGHNPMLNPVNYPNQMPSSSFQEHYANYMNFHSMQSANSSQPTNMFNFGFHPAPQNQVSEPQGNGNTSVG